MTRVDFYLLPDVHADAKERFTCRLAYRAASAGQTVHVRCEENRVDALDELLWAYPPEQFLPHRRLNDSDEKAPVVLAGAADEPTVTEVLINLGADVPIFFPRFDRVSEIVLSSERDAGRERYRFYRDRGYPLFHHDLDEWE